jgi:hypothetical protein
MKPEQKFKQKLKKYFEKEGVEVFMIESPFAPGFPDMCIFKKESMGFSYFTKPIFIEAKIIKTENCKIKFEKWQTALYERLEKKGLYPEIEIFVRIEKTKKVFTTNFCYINHIDYENKKFSEYKHCFSEEMIN